MEKNLTSIRELVEQCLRNKDIPQARETLDTELKKAGLNRGLRDKFKDLFLKYPPDNKTCPVCNKETIEHIFTCVENRVMWKPGFCQPCKLLEYRQKMAEDIDQVMSEVVAKRFVNAKITDFPAVYKDLYKSKEGLFLHGARGTGKTHLMAALAREIILKAPTLQDSQNFYRDDRYTPVFVSTPELLMRIRACYNNDDISEEELLDRYSRKEILMLDDLGAEKPTEWVLQTLYLIIDRRYRHMKKTIISSNYTLDQIAKRLDDRISSRIAGMCQVIQIKGKDRRLK